jgi:outer membrane lipoprotein-sorting protein
MTKQIKLVLFSIALISLFSHRAFAAPPDQKELQEVLHQLDIAAARFQSTSADVEIEIVQQNPVYEKDIQKGSVYYERSPKAFQMSAHFLKEADDVTNGKADFKDVPKTYVYSGGAFRLYEKKIDQLTTLTKAAQYESWFMLGFGASGKDLAKKWNITYVGTEKIDGVNTAQLELVPIEEAIRKNLPKVTIWIDPARDVNLKQVFDQGAGQSRTCIYSNIKVNQQLPADAFNLGTDSKTQYVNR